MHTCKHILFSLYEWNEMKQCQYYNFPWNRIKLWFYNQDYYSAFILEMKMKYQGK